MDGLSFLELSVEVYEESVPMVVLLRFSFLTVLFEDAELVIAMVCGRGGGVNWFPLAIPTVESGWESIVRGWCSAFGWATGVGSVASVDT